MTKTLLLVRHGETDGNLHRIVQTGDTPLNKSGLHQANLAAGRIHTDFGAKLVVCASDYTRAHQTAQAIAHRAGVDIALDPLLRERNLGNLRGRPYADLGLDPFAQDYHPPGGESWEQFFERVADLWSTVPTLLATTPDSHVLVLVTHGLVLRAIALHHLTVDVAHDPDRLRDSSDQDSPWLNTSITALRQETPERWKILAFNNADHLNEGSYNEDGAIA